MSILNVEHLTHGFGDRAIFSDVSFRLLKGEHTKAGEETPLTIAIKKEDWKKAAAGEYADTVTFTISYVDKSE